MAIASDITSPIGGTPLFVSTACRCSPAAADASLESFNPSASVGSNRQRHGAGMSRRERSGYERCWWSPPAATPALRLPYRAARGYRLIHHAGHDEHGTPFDAVCMELSCSSPTVLRAWPERLRSPMNSLRCPGGHLLQQFDNLEPAVRTHHR